jgi:hypothetical protein
MRRPRGAQGQLRDQVQTGTRPHLLTRGSFLAFPARLDMESPAYVHAAGVCGASFLGRAH